MGSAGPHPVISAAIKLWVWTVSFLDLCSCPHKVGVLCFEKKNLVSGKILFSRNTKSSGLEGCICGGGAAATVMPHDPQGGGHTMPSMAAAATWGGPAL